MAQYVIPFATTIPAGTLEEAPYTDDLDLDYWLIERIDLEVPPGPAGQMGFQIYNNGVPWIPQNPGEWFVWDNARESYYMTDQPTGSGWAVVGYNTGTYNHTVTTRWHVNPPSSAATTTTAPTVTFVTTGVDSGQDYVTTN